MAYFDAPYRPADLTVDSSHSLVANMVAWFPLTAGSGSVAQCILHPSHTGTLGSGVTWETSERGTSVFSDGSNLTGGINTGNPSSVQITGDLTIAAWVKCDNATPSSNQYIVSKYDAGSGQRAYAIALLSSGSVRFTYQSSGNPYNSAEDVDSSATLTAGSWHFVVGTFQASTAGKIYIDGELDTSNTSSVPSSIFNSSANLYISGIDGASGPSNCFEGNIQNVKVWSRALSATEVKTLYARAWTASNYDTEALWLSPPASPVLSSASEATALMANCVGWWPLVEGSGSTATDISGNSYTGTARSSQGWATTSLGAAADNTSLTNGGFTFGDQADLDMNGNKSFSMWVKPNGGSVTQMLLEKRKVSGGLEGYACYIRYGTNSTVGFLADSGSSTTTASSASALVTNVWSNVCVVVSGNDATIYVNGVAGTTVTSTDFAADLSNTVDFVVGHAQRDPLGSDDFDGNIQNVRVWNRDLSEDEITLLYQRPWIGAEYNETAPLYPPVPSSLTPLDSSNSILVDQVGWWPLTETDDFASGAADISGNGNNGTQTGGVLSEFSELGTVASFDGVNDYFDLGDNYDFGDGTTDAAFSISGWIYIDTLPAVILSKTSESSSTTSVSSYVLSVNSSGVLGFRLYDQSGGNQIRAVSASSSFSTGQWYHVAGTYTGSGQQTGLQIYINGVNAVNSQSVVGTYVAMHNSTETAKIGCTFLNNATYESFNDGYLSNVRLWSRALSATEVANIYYSPWLGSAYPSTGGGTPSYFVAAQFNRLGIGPRFRRL